MPAQRKEPDDLDSPWKEALEHFLEPFLALCFPRVHAAIDWTRGYQSLDKELQQITRDAAVRKRLADKLFKVWRKDGKEAWLLIHVEVQGQRERGFAERMFVYYYRIRDRRHRPVVSLAVLCDEHPDWRPDRFVYNNLDCELDFRFPMVKLIDYRPDEAALEHSANPFAAVILAQLKVLETRHVARDSLAMETSTDQGTLRSRTQTRTGTAAFSRTRLDVGPSARARAVVPIRPRAIRGDTAHALRDKY